MAFLVAAAVVFVGSHLVLSHPLRAPLLARLGAAGFRILYSLVALASFGWMVVAFRAVPPQAPCWIAGDGLWGGATVIMLLASILLVGSLSGNPALPGRAAPRLATQQALGVFAITRHPMMWSFALWSIAHAMVAPNPATLVLCVAVALLALIGSAGQDAKKTRIMGTTWQGWKARTSFLPFARQLSGKSGWGMALPGWSVAILGIGLWLAATWAHQPAGVAAAGIWRWVG